MSPAAARNSRSSNLALRSRHRKIFTEGILRPSADLCKCHGAGAVQYARRPRPPPAPRRPPPSCKLHHMKTIAIEEHFITPMYRQKVAANEFRNFYLTSRSEQIGHDIVEQNSDLGAKRLAHMDAAGIDVQVLSFGSPGPQGFGADVAIPMAKDANDLAHEAVKAHPDRFAAFAALATADPGAAAEELGRCVTKLLRRPRRRGRGAWALRHQARFQGRDDPRPHPREFPRREEILGHLRARPGARRAALSAPHPTASGRGQGLFPGIRGPRPGGLGFRGGYELPFFADRLRRGVRRLPAPQDHPRASGRRVAFRDAPAERSHLARGRAKRS